MRKIKKTFVAMLCVMLLIASAVTAYAATPYAVTVPCPECSDGTVTQYTSSKYEHDERFDCSHKNKGYDLYGAYEVTVRRSCDSCSYSTSYSYTDHVFKSCHGYN